MANDLDVSTTLRMLEELRAIRLDLGAASDDLQYIFFALHQLIFAINLLATSPSPILIGVGLKSMRQRYGGMVEAVLYMAFGSAVNLVTSVILLRKRQIKLLQTLLIRGILSNMHLMLGLGFVAGAVTGLILPTASQLLAKPVTGRIVKQSCSIAIVFNLVYFGLLWFQLKTNHSLFETYCNVEEEETGVTRRKKQLRVGSAIAIIAVSTTFVGFNTYFAVNSLEGLLNQTDLTASFVSIVLLPLFTNDLEPIMAAYRGGMDLCLQVTVGKCIQNTLFVIPVVVIIGWGRGIDEMMLNFNGFDVAALFSSALYIAFLTNDGKSDWWVSSWNI
ncbi:hypothetical protein CC78DRAFT_614821 [Lojkania enalia]|uniref:Sodium/calcium exchanger membrane region domain-containing protein n=1 Tax=Lojkania enalia TaxID=147567 RepID=A0A9P4N1Z1_9PLEO|nr:hypothetical protein CC78DRAFT_614821 [Didymosphaeria enalia]